MIDKNLEYELLKELAYDVFVSKPGKDKTREDFEKYHNYIMEHPYECNKKLYDFIENKYINYRKNEQKS